MKRVLSGIIGLLVPLILLAGAGAAAWVVVNSGPQIERNTAPRPAPIVEAIELSRGDFARVAEAFGPVIPAKEVTITPEVTGRVVELHAELQAGGLVREGEVLIRIDDADYKIALDQAKNVVAEAEAALEVERGRQMVAEREWELFGQSLPDAEKARALALREPQLRQAEARIASAKSAVEQAGLELKRTTIRAPFDALVLEEAAELGQRVAPGAMVARLVGTEQFWVRAALPVARLGAVLEASGDHAPARLFPEVPGGEVAPAEGKLIRPLGSVDPQGRMAQVLVEVTDPLRIHSPRDAGHPPLILDSYVRVELDGGVLPGVVSLPRKALRENREVWVVAADNTLQVRDITVLWQQGETVAVEDVFEAGDRPVVSPVSDLSPGMQVRILGEDNATEAAPL